MNRFFSDRYFQAGLFVAGLFLAFLVAANLLVLGGSAFTIALNSSLSAPLAICLVIAGMLVWGRLRAEKQSRQMWSGLISGWLLWAVAEAIWAGYAISGAEIPYPSLADLFWLLGYVPLGIGLIARTRALPRSSRLQNTFIWVVSALVVLLVFYSVLLPIVQGFDLQRAGESALNLAYPLGDLFILIVVGRLFLLYEKGTYGFVWQLLAVGFLLMTLSDIAYSYSTWVETYYPGGQVTLFSQFVVDVPYVASYLSWLIGLYALARLLRVERLIDPAGIVPAGVPQFGHILIYTRADGAVINTSFNYSGFFESRSPTGESLAHALGIPEQEGQEILARLRRDRKLSEVPVRVRAPSGAMRVMLLYGLANRYPESEFSGGNMVLRFPVTDVWFDQGLDQYDRSMVTYLLEQSGSDFKTGVSRYLQNYHNAGLVVLLRLLEREGGAMLVDALLEDLRAIAADRGWPLGFDARHGVEGGPYDLDLIRAAMPVLVAAARKRTAEMMDPFTVGAQMRLVESRLGEALQREAVRYGKAGSEAGFVEIR